MVFTSFDFVAFFVVVAALWWLLPEGWPRRGFLVGASYFFYGFVHPWFCLLLAVSTVVDYGCALAIERFRDRRRWFLVLSLLTNLGILGTFKYFNFFSGSVHGLLARLGVAAPELLIDVFLPAGISFYTFQTLSYTIDVYRGRMAARRNLLDFALFVSMFPQLVAGPIERAVSFLPQIECKHVWKWEYVTRAAPLFVWGFFKKLVVADNMAVYVNKAFMLEEPSLLIISTASVAFAVQIFADFSAYTDIATGAAAILGFRLSRNFDAPYAAVSPSDFWRRWHISFSSWIRDYLYIPLGGSRTGPGRYLVVLLVSMGLSGLWHGAEWHFVWWGLYHGILILVYRLLGLSGKWKPATLWGHILAWLVMFVLTIFGWMLFRCPSLAWLVQVFARTLREGTPASEIVISTVWIVFVALYALPLVLMYVNERYWQNRWIRGVLYGFALVAIVVFARDGSSDFIYFRF